MRPVKCLYCSQMIDRQNESFVTTQSKRYAHESCALEQEKEKSYRESLNNLIEDLFDGDVNYGVIGKQISNFQQQYKYTLSGIAGTLYYCYKIKRMDISRAEGIGIVPFYYKQAREYFATIEKAKSNAIGSLHIEKKTVHIKAPKAEPINKLREISLDKLEKEFVKDE